ncbi:FAD-dependent monooxygenase [Paenibacillus taichungensis]|uniref:FAD-dependent monooxygenase n=1 Tax=Paenibacillus taichungensis TaxID=484184 RepID=UPI002871EC21|nr:FAD-dependent monooxygenase [Paenibacillus taichungensis]MDR9744934.1 FAD-dependent monooxygenase [Paenibacillus taichungensis]
MNQNTHLKTDVCIVGAGPGGALLSFLLKRQGISTILIERQPHLLKSFRGEVLNADGEHVLNKHGLYTSVTQRGVLPLEQIQYWENGQIIHTIFPGEQESHVGIHVPQDHLLEVIVSQSQHQRNEQVLYNTVMTGLLRNKADHTVGINIRQEGRPASIEAAVIVGADGRYSAVRKHAGLTPDIRKHGYDLLWARIPAPTGWQPAVRMASMDGQQLALFSQFGGYVQIGWNIPQGSFSKLREQPFAPFVQKLVAAFPCLADSVAEHIQTWSDFVLLSVESSFAELWAQDNVVLLGDAAHTMTPTGAFGLNAALEDADVLAELLIDMAADQFTSTERLQELQARRGEKVKQQLARQLEMESSFQQRYESFQ